MAEANIMDIKITCPDCKKPFPFKELENHMKFECEHRQIKCAKKDCEFSGKEDELSEHYAHEHRRDVLEAAPQFLNNRTKCPICMSSVSSTELVSHLCSQHEHDLIKEFGGRLQLQAPNFSEVGNGSENLRQIMNTHYEDMIKVLDNAHRSPSRRNSKISTQASVDNNNAIKTRLTSQDSVQEDS